MLLCVYLVSILMTTSYSAEQQFKVGLRILEPIVASVKSNLMFPDSYAGETKTLVVNPSESNAAVIELRGTKGKSITSSIIEDSITLYSDASDEGILVSGFTITGSNSLDMQGLASLSVGASAQVLPSNMDGNYIGQATIRITYQ